MKLPAVIIQGTSISNPEMRAFIETFIKDAPKLTVADYFKLSHSNHEIWRRCIPCDEYWDARKALSGICCPKCGAEGTI